MQTVIVEISAHPPNEDPTKRVEHGVVFEFHRLRDLAPVPDRALEFTPEVLHWLLE